jgi:hypothetical protein
LIVKNQYRSRGRGIRIYWRHNRNLAVVGDGMVCSKVS